MKSSNVSSKGYGSYGISLVEVAVVGMILGVLFLVIGRYFRTSAGVALEARQNDAANQLIEKLSADLRKQNFYFILGADSNLKGGNSLTSTHYDYMVDWNKSQMKNTLTEFDQKVRQAGFSRFKISCYLLFRTNVKANDNDTDYAWFSPYNNDNTRAWQDPSRMRFIDRNGDSQYYNAIFDPASKKWLPELPPVGVKDLVIEIYKGNRVVGTKTLRLDLNDYSQESTSTSENKLKLNFFRPTSEPFHERVTAAQRASLDLVIDKTLLPIQGLSEACREKRFDTVNDPIKGFGGMVVQGQTLPGAVVKIFTYASYQNCDTCPKVMTSRSWGTPQEITVTDKSGIFTMILDSVMMGKISLDLAEVATKYYSEIKLMGRATLGGETSADAWQSYFPTVIKSTPSLSSFRPTGTKKTLAPTIKFMSNQGIIPLSASFEVDGSPIGSISPGSEVFGANIGGPYDRLPPILTNHADHTVKVSYADEVCYKATGTWTFRIDVGADATPPTIDSDVPAVYPDENFIEFYADFKDPQSGIDYRTIEVLLDGIPVKDMEGNQGPAFVNKNVDFFYGMTLSARLPRPPDGPHSITVRAANFAEGAPLTTSQTYNFSVP